MATSYKTPGVYVEEISKFPPSVAEVETAIPAFIGYTEKAKQFANDDLKNIPFKIASMLDFETYFGGANKPSVNSITVNATSQEVVSADISYENFLYDSLRLFYTNGGGICYIVAVGSFSDSFDKQDFLDGLEKIKEIDEPTLLLFPDAVNLGQTDLKDVQQAALMQCGTLMDRFAILDVKSGDELGDDLRNDIGMTNLKYGAVYSPWLKADLTETFEFADVYNKLKDTNGNSVSFNNFVNDTSATALIQRLEDVLDDKATLTALSSTLSTLITTFSAQRSACLAAINTQDSSPVVGVTDVALVTAFTNLIKTVYKIAGEIDTKVSTLTDATLQNTYKSKITNDLRDGYGDLIEWELALANETVLAPANEFNAYTAKFNSTATYTANVVPSNSAWQDAGNNIFTTNATLIAIDDNISYKNLLNTKVSTDLANITNDVSSFISEMLAEAANTASAIEATLEEKSNAYKVLLKSIESQSGVIPPSGAIAGLYCYTDNSRGVWKAPANISISGINGLTVRFRADQLDALNIDVNAGKSINAIRAITGQGIMVMGGRTLAGNDNEWRYVPVRRFFNFVEESTKKSTNWAVFEPNDANLWLKVRTMIENFLYNLWRRGALAGVKPEHAYYVSCGLGKTMTAQDILEGKLNVEIGMAAVRPAEFIVLKFSHKLQES